MWDVAVGLKIVNNFVTLWFSKKKKKKRRKCTFSPYILHFFHFDPYILFLPLSIPKPINAWHLGHFRHPTNSKS